MTAKTTTIVTEAGTVKTRTASRFVAVRYRATTVFVAHVRYARVAVGHDRAEVIARGEAEAVRRGMTGEVEVWEERPFVEVVKRSDTFAVAKRAAEKGEGACVTGFVVDTETGARG